MRPTRFASHATAWGSALAAAVIAVVLLTSAPAQAEINVRIDIGHAPPPPRFVVVSPPHERRYPGEDFYVVDDPSFGDNDCFHYQGYYWVFRDGYWYRAMSWRGPFRVLEPRYVPMAFYRHPAMRWHHHPAPPPIWENNRYRPQNGYEPRGDRHEIRGAQQPPYRVEQRQPPVIERRGGGNPGDARGRGHVPPGQAKKDDRGKDKGKGNGGGNGKGDGNGNGNGKGGH